MIRSFYKSKSLQAEPSWQKRIKNKMIHILNLETYKREIYCNHMTMRKAYPFLWRLAENIFLSSLSMFRKTVAGGSDI